MPSFPFVWLNGALLRQSDARISPGDRGLLAGDGVFETLVCRAGVPFAARRHWERLRAGCAIMGLAAPSEAEFREALAALVRASHLREGRLRFTITRGDMAEGIQRGTRMASAGPLNAPAVVERIRTVPWVRNERDPLAGVKSTSYAGNLRALEFARAAGAGEAVFANTRGELCEGAVSNVFVVQQCVVRTPPLSSGCLAGVTRALVIEICQEHRIPVEEVALPMSALGECEEVFITSSTRDVQPVAQVDDHVLPGAPGPVTRRLASLFHGMIARDPDP